MSYYTNGLADVSASASTFPFTGAETVGLDTNLSSGQNPQEAKATLAELLGVVTSAGPTNTAYASTVTIDGKNGQIQTVGTLTGGIALTFANFIAGVRYRIKLVQDGTGTRAATITNTSKVSGAQSTTAAYVDWLEVFFDGTTYWCNWLTHFA